MDFFFLVFRFTFLSYVRLLWSPSQGRRIRQEVEDISGTYIYFLGTYNNVQTKLIMMSDREKSSWSSQFMSYECLFRLGEYTVGVFVYSVMTQTANVSSRLPTVEQINCDTR